MYILIKIYILRLVRHVFNFKLVIVFSNKRTYMCTCVQKLFSDKKSHPCRYIIKINTDNFKGVSIASHLHSN